MLDLVDVLVDAVAELVEDRAAAGRRARGLDHVAGQAELHGRSAWIARLRCVDEPRMSESA